uniref:Uncharacterized protein n=1 Tax=Physcomitrium patens TaxID=3218 RepID=A0A2K1KC83_PHYPA|nr:hypothetical protein PHYPA_010572 [Physcomitrium patens]
MKEMKKEKGQSHNRPAIHPVKHTESSIGRELEQGFKLGRFFLCATQIVN